MTFEVEMTGTEDDDINILADSEKMADNLKNVRQNSVCIFPQKLTLCKKENSKDQSEPWNPLTHRRVR